MCYNLETSLFSFTFSVVTCVAIYKYTENKEKKAICLFFIFVALMQLIEAALWIAVDNDLPEFNKYVSYLGFWLNLL